MHESQGQSVSINRGYLFDSDLSAVDTYGAMKPSVDSNDVIDVVHQKYQTGIVQMKLLTVVLSSMMLVACGGGGSSSPSDSPITKANLTLSGTAATGKAIAGAIINAKCNVGTGTATTIANGTYSLVVADGKLPCLLQLTDPLDNSKLHTLATEDGIANITPLTEMLAARVLRNDPVVFFAGFDAVVAASTITTVAVKAAQTDVGTILSSTVDTSTLGDFIATPLKAATPDNVSGGDAQDKMLDALRLKINAAQLTQVVTALANTANTADIKQEVANIAAVAAPPVADAGVAQNVVTGTAVTLDASSSAADSGRTLTYAWTLTTKPVGSLATLASPASAKPTFTADIAGTYVATVIVNDGKVNSNAAAVSINASVANAAPVANAGVAQNVVAGTVVTLDGSASSDANSDPLTYAWTLTSKPAGSTAVLSSSTSAQPTFTADVAGTYVASLVVNDGKVNSIASTVAVTAAVANVVPVANAGVSQRVVVGAIVSLDGSASSDANNNPLTYTWTLTAKPTGSLAILSSPTPIKPTFTADVQGTYVVSLIVNDGKVTSTQETTTITSVPRIVSALGISLNDNYNDFCGMSGEFTTLTPMGSSKWTVNNCRVYGTAGSIVWARIQNNGSTALTLTSIHILAGYFGNSFNINPSSQTLNPGDSMDFALPLWLSLEVTNAIATFNLTGEPDLVVQLSGSMTLP